MMTFAWQSLLLLGLAYFLGCWIACLVRRMVGAPASVGATVPAGVAIPAAVTPTGVARETSGQVGVGHTTTGIPPGPSPDAFRRADTLEPTPASVKPSQPAATNDQARGMGGTAPAATPGPATDAIVERYERALSGQPSAAPNSTTSAADVAASAGAAAAAAAAAAAGRDSSRASSRTSSVTPAGTPTSSPDRLDDLQRIRTIDRDLELALNRLGIRNYAQIGGWRPDDVSRVSQELGFKGRIEQENWIEQAQILAGGHDTFYSSRLARGETASTARAPGAQAASGQAGGVRPSSMPGASSPPATPAPSQPIASQPIASQPAPSVRPTPPPAAAVAPVPANPPPAAAPRAPIAQAAPVPVAPRTPPTSPASPPATTVAAPDVPRPPRTGIEAAAAAAAALAAAAAAAKAAPTRAEPSAPVAQRTPASVDASASPPVRPPAVSENAAFAAPRATAPAAPAPAPAKAPAQSAPSTTTTTTSALPANPAPSRPPAADDRIATGSVRDRLQRISGITPEIEKLLNVQGITRYAQIAQWATGDIERFDRLLGYQGRIQRENWIEQAQILSRGGETASSREHDRRTTANAAPSPVASLPAVAPAAAIARPQSVTDARPAPSQPAPPVTRVQAPSTRVPDVHPSAAASSGQTAEPTRAEVQSLATAAASAAAAAAAQAAPRPSRLGDAIRGNETRPAEQSSDQRPSEHRTSDLSSLRSVRSEAFRSGASSAGSGPRAAEFHDLKRIRGIGVLIEKKLNSMGISRYEQIAEWTMPDIERVSQVLDFKGRIERENWVEQARILASGGQTEFSRRADRGDIGGGA